ncbi:MAG TPA: DUF1501 domain-containing protein [Thermoanaerobaculia bacterium]|nr:DUF1501 domain-containing protein [Thermoanaerobaculia bacterium]
MNRRDFVKTTTLALFGARLYGAAKKPRTVITIFQRGAVDGLNMIVPYGERAYYDARPTIAIPRDQVLDLDGFFGAHPSLQSLLPLWKNRSLAVIHAAGSPDATRSHFDAQDFMESGTPGIKSTRDGFLARALAARTGGAKLRAVSLTQTMPRIFAGSQDAIATPDITKFGNAMTAKVFASMYPEAFEAARVLQSVQAASTAAYPRNPLGNSLQQLARLIKSDIGLELAFTDVGGWDTHAGQNTPLANNLRGFAEAIAAFANDLGSRMHDVTVVTTSEFGRTVRENGNRGTDHGHGTVMLVLGGGVKGGMHGPWPGLGREQLFEGRDLAITTDFRDVFAEVLGVNVFPGHKARPVRFSAS